MPIVFKGSYIDGADVDIPEWCGASLSEDEYERLWYEINETDLIEMTDSRYVEIELAVDDAPPGMNDTYYSVECSDIEVFKSELREAIWAVVRRTK